MIKIMQKKVVSDVRKRVRRLESALGTVHGACAIVSSNEQREKERDAPSMKIPRVPLLASRNVCASRHVQ